MGKLRSINQTLSRRSALRKITGGAATLAAVASLPSRLRAADDTGRARLKGNKNKCQLNIDAVPAKP